MQEDAIVELTVNEVGVVVSTLGHYKGLPLPFYATAGSSGMDLMAAIDGPLSLPPGDTVLVPTGLRVAIPTGFEIQVRPRSGLAIRHGITVINAPGTIDSDYRGEIKVALINLGGEAFEIARGMRIAQAVLSRVYRVSWKEAAKLSTTDRGSGGFGHTGV